MTNDIYCRICIELYNVYVLTFITAIRGDNLPLMYCVEMILYSDCWKKEIFTI